MRIRNGKIVAGTIKWILALILVIIQVYPIFYVIVSSFKTTDDFRHLPSYALPSSLNFQNYIAVFTKSHMPTYFMNSIIILLGVVIPLLLFSLMAGFALTYCR